MDALQQVRSFHFCLTHPGEQKKESLWQSRRNQTATAVICDEHSFPPPERAPSSTPQCFCYSIYSTEALTPAQCKPNISSGEVWDQGSDKKDFSLLSLCRTQETKIKDITSSSMWKANLTRERKQKILPGHPVLILQGPGKESARTNKHLDAFIALQGDHCVPEGSKIGVGWGRGTCSRSNRPALQATRLEQPTHSSLLQKNVGYSIYPGQKPSQQWRLTALSLHRELDVRGHHTWRSQ